MGTTVVASMAGAITDGATMAMGMATTAGAITVVVVMVMAAGADLGTEASAMTVVSTAEAASMAVGFMEAGVGFTVAGAFPGRVAPGGEGPRRGAPMRPQILKVNTHNPASPPPRR